MAGMYPNNQVIEIFGQEVEWPGVGPDGKFTNGDFNNPMIKPSMIPAETLNLILDNLSAVITKCGGTPNAASLSQIADLITHLPEAHKIIKRDADGRAKVAAPLAEDDIARLAEIIESARHITPDGFGGYHEGRNLLEVTGNATISPLMAEFRERCNGDGKPDYSGLQIGDYLDGIDLVSGSVNVPWNDEYKNNRLVLSGFNQYKGIGDTENTLNHLLFTFRHCPLSHRMNPSDSNTGGYAATEMRTFLESDFRAALIAALGDYILPVYRLSSTKGSWAWGLDNVFLPTEYEVFGATVWSEVGYGGGFQCQFPIHQKSSEYLVKRLNGARMWYWLGSPSSGSSADFCAVGHYGHAYSHDASAVGGVAPAFCIA